MSKYINARQESQTHERLQTLVFTRLLKFLLKRYVGNLREYDIWLENDK